MGTWARQVGSGVRAGVTGVLLGASGLASASVVVYDNSEGTFGWEIGVHDLDGTNYPGTFLDITQPPTQTGERRPGTVGKWYYPNFASDEPSVRYLIGESGVQTARTTDLQALDWNGGHIYTWPTRDYTANELVSVTDRWDIGGPYFYHLPFSSDLAKGTPAISADAFLGIRVKMADTQWHYGWIHFVDYKTPVAWAYETLANIPIQIPVPAPSIAGLAALAGLRLCSRRRHD